MNTVDVIVLVVLLLNGIIGAFRGFVWQVFRIGSLVLAFYLGNRFAGDLGQALPEGWSAGDRSGRTVIAFIAIGAVTYLVLFGLGYLARGLINKARLASSDRSLGFILGALKGGAFVAIGFQVLIFFVAFLPADVKEQLVGGPGGSPPPSQAFRLHVNHFSKLLNDLLPSNVQDDGTNRVSSAAKLLGR